MPIAHDFTNYFPWQDSKRLQKLMGKNREEYEKQLAARLARRERRRAMGLDSDDSEDDSGTLFSSNLSDFFFL